VKVVFFLFLTIIYFIYLNTKNQLHNLAVQFWRRPLTATNPLVEIVITGIENGFETIELLTVELGQHGSGEVSKDQIKLADSTVSTAEEEPFAAPLIGFCSAHASPSLSLI